MPPLLQVEEREGVQRSECGAEDGPRNENSTDRRRQPEPANDLGETQSRFVSGRATKRLVGMSTNGAAQHVRVVATQAWISCARARNSDYEKHDTQPEQHTAPRESELR